MGGQKDEGRKMGAEIGGAETVCPDGGSWILGILPNPRQIDRRVGGDLHGDTL